MAQWEYTHRYRLDNYTFVLPFERDFDSVQSTLWMQRNWMHSITLSIAYVALIYIGQRLMHNRKPYDLEKALTIWNTALAVFSIAGVCRMTPEFVWSISANSWRYSMCTASFAQGVTGFWTEMFAMSKVAEFGDTLFIVLRKRPVIFLHWYHHITVLMYTWHAYKDHTASGRWFIWMNYAVHAVMYSYYALRSFHIRLPKRVAMLVTSLQILQMVVGILIALNAYRIKIGGGHCQQTFDNLYFSFTIYFTYFLLFCNFFYNAYLKSGNRYAKQRDATQHDASSNAVANGSNGYVKKQQHVKAA
jgi:elongation of very long chain fatty acids protein 6